MIFTLSYSPQNLINSDVLGWEESLKSDWIKTIFYKQSIHLFWVQIFFSVQFCTVTGHLQLQVLIKTTRNLKAIILSLVQKKTHPKTHQSFLVNPHNSDFTAEENESIIPFFSQETLLLHKLPWSGGILFCATPHLCTPRVISYLGFPKPCGAFQL